MTSAALVVALASLVPTHSQATQQSGADQTAPRWRNAAAQMLDLSVNAGLGALTAGVRAKLGGRSFWPAFKQGVLGGTINYAGKRIIGTREPAFRLVGREVAALGASVVANGGEGRAPFAAAILPFGPARFYVGQPGVRVKLDLAGSIALVYTATHSHGHLDLGASLAAGTPILGNVTLDGVHQGGHIAGVIAHVGTVASRRTIAHELVHTAEYDFTFIAWGEPAERALAPNVPAGRFIHRYFDLGANMTLWELGDWLVPYRQRPWEHEAVLMTDRPWP